jgi:type IV pili sensor histidine kinase/response regulator
MMRLLAPNTILHPLLLTGLCWVSATTTLQAEISANQENAFVHLSRYRLQLPQPTIAQRDPLQRVIKSLHFNHQASVGSAITTILKDSGYTLTSFHPDARVHQLLALPLPKVHHSLGPITLTQALSTLAGSPWRLVVDPIHRLISFQLPDYFQTETAGIR